VYQRSQNSVEDIIEILADIVGQEPQYEVSVLL